LAVGGLCGKENDFKEDCPAKELRRCSISRFCSSFNLSVLATCCMAIGSRGWWKPITNGLAGSFNNSGVCLAEIEFRPTVRESGELED